MEISKECHQNHQRIRIAMYMCIYIYIDIDIPIINNNYHPTNPCCIELLRMTSPIQLYALKGEVVVCLRNLSRSMNGWSRGSEIFVRLTGHSQVKKRMFHTLGPLQPWGFPKGPIWEFSWEPQFIASGKLWHKKTVQVVHHILYNYKSNIR